MRWKFSNVYKFYSRKIIGNRHSLKGKMPEKEATLPLELWRVVLSYLSVADLCRCSQVCKEWRELVKSLDSTRWKTLFLAAKKWRHPNWPNTTEKDPSSWKNTYKAHHIASQQWINRSIDVRCSPFFIALRRKPEKVILHVGPGKKYLSIRDAMSAASPFDRIVLHPGIYDEQHFLVLKFPIEIYGEGEIGDVVIQMTIEQQCSTARLVNVVVQPGTGMLVQNSPVILKVATGHIQVDNCIFEQGHIQVSSPGSVSIRYCSFNHSFIILRSVGFSRVENCEFVTDDTSAIIIEGIPPITRQRPISRPVEGWMVANGIDSLGLEDLYDLSFSHSSVISKNRNKKTSKDSTKETVGGIKKNKGNSALLRDNDNQSKGSTGTHFTMATTNGHSYLNSVTDVVQPRKGKYQLDTQSRDVVRSIHGCVVRNNNFKTCKGAVLVRRRGHAWIECNEMAGISYAVRCMSGAKVVVLYNTIHNCDSSGIFFRERSHGLVAGNDIFLNKEAGVDIRSGSDPILQHNRIHSGKRSGVVILDRGRGLIRDNDIYDNAEAGVYILYRGNPVVKHNRIWSGQAAGIAITEEGRGHISHNDICGMEWGGVDIRNGGNPVVSNNWIRDGQADGIVIGEGGKGIIMDNDILANSGCGIWLLTISKPVIYGNRIGKSGDSGISFVSSTDVIHENQQLSSQFVQQEQDQEQLLQPLFYDEDLTSSSNFDDHDHTLDFTGPRPDKNYATIDSNTIYDNAGHGIHFCANEGLLIRDNIIHSNKGCGISIVKPADITIQDNGVCKNEGSGISIDTNSSASIHGNGIYGNHKHGLHISGKGIIRENDVFSNLLCGIQICGPGDPFVTRNRVQSTRHHGISIMENARGFVEWNDIYESKVASLYQHPESTTHLYNNNVVQIKLAESKAFCTYDTESKTCKLDESVDMEGEPSRPRPSNITKLNEKSNKLTSISSSGTTNIVSIYTGCHGRTRFCVIS